MVSSMLNTATCLDGSSCCCCCTPSAVSTGADAVKLSHGGPCDVCMDNLGYQSIGEGFLGGAGMFVPVSMANTMSYIASTARSSRYARSFASRACSV